MSPKSIKVKFRTVDQEEAGQRLDNFLLRELKGVPKTMIYRIVRKGEVRVNKGRVQAAYRLQAGDVIRIPPVRTRLEQEDIKVSDGLRTRLEASILYEDDQLFILNKPSGLAVHGGSEIQCGLIEALRVMYPQYKHLELVHRLDRDTSGCILIAKKRSILKLLHDYLRKGEIRKTYHAIVVGEWPEGCDKVDEPLLKQAAGLGDKMVKVSSAGKASITTFEVLARYDQGATLIAARPKTGRTHQIRVHCLSQGCPIMGDQRYCDKKILAQYKQQFNVNRLCLHAHRLSFYLPEIGQIQVTAPYDDAWLQITEELKA